MKVFGWTALALLLAGCAGKDEGGCPFDFAAALGESCREEGLQCGEYSLCDPCKTDLSECERIACEDGVWVEVTPEKTCEE